MTKISNKCDTPDDQSLNYKYVIGAALKLSDKSQPRVLDYGCGFGDVVEMAREQGHDFTGVDTFEGYYLEWSDQIKSGAEEFVSKIENGKIAADDNSYDVVVSNQVFEHIIDPISVLPEINRVLKPGGIFLALFPVSQTWFEPHLGLYFPHWLFKYPRFQNFYLKTCRKLGLGYYGKEMNVQEWADTRQKLMEDVVFYHSSDQFKKWCLESFGSNPISNEVDYMLFRLQHSRFKNLSRFADNSVFRWLLKFVCVKRAGVVFVVRKPEAG